MIFDRVFDSHYFNFWLMHLPQESIQSCRLSAPSRTRVQDHAIRFRDLSFEDIHEVCIKTEFFHWKCDGCRIKNAHHDGFGIRSRKDRGTDLELFFVDDDREAAVLCRVFDVELEAG